MNDDYVNARECNIPLWEEESKQFFADSKMAWEWIKFKIREFSVDFSKMVARKKREEESDLVKNYERLKVVHELNTSDDTFYNLEKIKSELELLEERKTEGIIVTASARWHEHGEKSNKYFLSLEKRNHVRKHVRKLHLSGVITYDPHKILESGKIFYKELYASKHPNLNSEESKLFFENGNIPKLI